MSFKDRILLRMFGRPEGLLGRLGGIILARANRKFAEEIIALLNLEASEKVLEVGFGPGAESSFSPGRRPRGRSRGSILPRKWSGRRQRGMPRRSGPGP